MSGDALAFLDGPVEHPGSTTVPSPANTEAPPPPAADVIEENPAGGATPLASDAAAPAAKEGDEAPKGDTKFVPLPTFLDMRDENKKLKERLKELEPPGGFTPPDPNENPGEYLQYRENMIHLQILNERMNFSEKSAVKEHGKELVGKARDWAVERFANDPGYEDRIMREADPYEVIVAEFNEHQLAQEFKDKETIEEFRAWKAEKAKGAKPPASGEAPPAPKTPPQAAPVVKAGVSTNSAAPAQDEPIPTTIADTPSQGGSTAVPVGAGQAFDGLFKP
jgi:hypothetical protein